MSSAPTAVSVENVSKIYGANIALDRVSMTIEKGTSLALAGRNGAGKSTLISIITGRQAPTSGHVRIESRGATPGIECVYQRSTLVPGLSASENIMLNNFPVKASGMVDWRAVRRRGEEALAEWGCAGIGDRPVEELAPVERKVVEICRALTRDPSVLLLDEPTAGLDYASAQRLFARIRELRQRGVSILYVSHHLEESFDVCDKTVVLRDGRVVMDRPLRGMEVRDLVEAMVGDTQMAHDKMTPPRAPTSTEPVLKVQNLSAGVQLRDVDIDVKPGECVGLAGLEGAGHMFLAQAICGFVRPENGTITLKGKLLSRHTVEESIGQGIGFIPEDRHDGGYVPALSVAENATLPIQKRFSGFLGMLRRRQRDEAYSQLGKEWSIKADSPEQPVEELSGGNQQKVVLARAMSTSPETIVLMNPTAGVDVAAKRSIYETVRSRTLAGNAVLIASAEDDDFSICHRVIVMFRGKVHRELKAPFTSHELAMAIQGK